ncbi:glutathione peroxidase [Peribacillus saganii]|uniref:Glutathione peroxidase n=1 Tax=Peribacillus saganii TaxID=2303992 RepID=A0A372LPN3_9BACI|nr:glutathione peroxidase [Peribacillus saganii]RFU69694.1 glutathione peroxidase [Peribacillus saganii]
MSVYQYEAKLINGEMIRLSEFEGKVLLIVNTASKCGFTVQYSELQQLYDRYSDKGFAVLGFPSNQFLGQEPGDEIEISSFCRLNYGVTFPLFAKIDVKGENAHPLFVYLAKNAPGMLGSKGIKWNFTKFLVDRNGNVIDRYSPQTKPMDIEEDIKKLLD